MIPRLLQPIIHPFRQYYLPIVDRHPSCDIETKMILSSLSSDDILGEIGANRGAATKLYAERCRFVFAFEANPATYQILKRYCKNQNNVKVSNLALWKSKGTLDLHSTRQGSGRVDSIQGLYQISYVKTVRVDCDILDSLNLPVTALAIDVEGAEVEVLQGARETLRRTKLVAVETHYDLRGEGTSESVCKLLGGLGYEIISKQKIGNVGAQDCLIFET